MKKILIILLLVIGSIFNGYSQYYSSWFTMPDTSTATLPKTFAENTLFYVADVSTIYVCDTVLTSGTTLGHWYSKGHLTTIPQSSMDTLTWLDPVISISPYTTCASGDSLDRYIADTTLSGWTKNNIYECNGSSWNEYVPVSGDAVTVIDSSNIFVYNGMDWVTVTSSVTTHWAMNGTDVFNTNSGNVGIGTGGTGISHKLEVYGDIGLLDNHSIEWSGTDNNILLGKESGYSLTSGSGTNNIFEGYQAGYNNLSGNSNIFQGSYAGLNNTTGSDNIFQGYASGEYNTTGYDNIFIGHSAGQSNTTGYQNVFIGRGAGSYNTIARWNVFIGISSGSSNTTGTNNMFLGAYSGNGNTTGNNNLFQGYAAGFHNTTGNNNVYLGYQAGYYDTLGVNNVFLGYQAGYYETGSNKLYIDNSNTTTPLIYGEFDNNYLNINGHLNATDSLGINSEYVSGFTYLDSLVTPIGNIVTGVPHIYADTITINDVTNINGNTYITDTLAIGTTTPDKLLDVHGNIVAGDGTNFKGMYIKQTSGVSKSFALVQNNTELLIGGGSWTKINFWTSGSMPAMELNTDGSCSFLKAIYVSGDGNFSGNLTISGSQTVNVTTVNAATYTLQSNDYILNVTYTTTGAVTITLPTAQTVNGRIVIIKDAGGNATTKNITVTTEGSQTIDGQPIYIINTDYEGKQFYSDGTNWFITIN